MTEETKTEKTVEELDTEAVDEVSTEKTIESEAFSDDEEETVEKVETEEEEPESEDEPTDEQEDEEEPAKRVVPKTEDYSFPDTVPEVLRGDLAAFANKNDMTQEQLNSSLEKFSSFNEQSRKAEQAFLAKEGQELVKSWGEEAKTNLNLTHQGLSHYDEKGTVAKMLKETGYFQHPEVLKLFHKIGKDLGEGGFLESSGHAPTKKKTFADNLFPQFKD